VSEARDIPPETIDWVEKLHGAVDECAAPVERANAARLVCRAGCAACCVDDLTVFEIEAAVIRRYFADLLESGTPHPRGACAFLDVEGHCRIYAHRPYVCRTQGLPLRWIDEDEDEDTGEPALVESRDICPKNVEGGPALEELAADECWTLGPFEMRLAERQSQADGGHGTRTPLRSLFKTQSDKKTEGATEDQGDQTTDRRRLPVVG
jgi:uncharacterized protein